ncbi:MAG: hypothetical protein Q8O30_13080 [Candidatus Omnitrophota bacterium]|nr:hypothetical protein [Candidatus Omnitrophota bacterium]
MPWNEVNYVYDFGLPTPPKQPLRLRRPGIPVASHGVFAERE